MAEEFWGSKEEVRLVMRLFFLAFFLLLFPLLTDWTFSDAVAVPYLLLTFGLIILVNAIVFVSSIANAVKEQRIWLIIVFFTLGGTWIYYIWRALSNGYLSIDNLLGR